MSVSSKKDFSLSFTHYIREFGIDIVLGNYFRYIGNTLCCNITDCGRCVPHDPLVDSGNTVCDSCEPHDQRVGTGSIGLHRLQSVPPGDTCEGTFGGF